MLDPVLDEWMAFRTGLGSTIISEDLTPTVRKLTFPGGAVAFVQGLAQVGFPPA